MYFEYTFFYFFISSFSFFQVQWMPNVLLPLLNTWLKKRNNEILSDWRFFAFFTGVNDTDGATRAANISANFRKNLKRLWWYNQGLGGNWSMYKTWSRKSRGTVLLRSYPFLQQESAFHYFWLSLFCGCLNPYGALINNKLTITDKIISPLSNPYSAN